MTATDRLAARRSRVAASWLVAASATVVAATAHALGGGGTPSVHALATALVVSGLVGMIVVGPRPSSPRILIGVVLDQAIFHSLFAFFAGAAGAVGAGGATGAIAPVGAHAAHTSLALPSIAASAPHTAGWPMTGTHVAAGAIAFLLVRFGIDAVARAVSTLALRVAYLFADAPTPLTVTVRPRVKQTAPALPPFGGILQRLELRRGPPSLAAL